MVRAPKNWKNRIVGYGEEDPQNLLANPKNARVHPTYQKDTLRSLLNEVGWVQSVIVNRRTNFVIDGHARIEVALANNEISIPVVYVDLNENEENMILGALDSIGALATYNQQAAKSLIENIITDDENIKKLLQSILEQQTDTEGLLEEDKSDDLNGSQVYRVTLERSLVTESVALLEGIKNAIEYIKPLLDSKELWGKDCKLYIDQVDNNN